jgi:hypothetical protein
MGYSGHGLIWLRVSFDIGSGRHGQGWAGWAKQAMGGAGHGLLLPWADPTMGWSGHGLGSPWQAMGWADQVGHWAGHWLGWTCDGQMLAMGSV